MSFQFYEAIKNGDLIQVIERLPFEDLETDDNWPIKTACIYGYFSIVKYLSEHGADLNSGIRFASKYGYLSIVKYLCEAGADIRSENDGAVQLASHMGHYEVVKYLCENGADVSKISEKQAKYISFCQTMETKIRDRAQKKIYFWWIPICYDLTRDCGKRMMQKNLEKTIELGLEFKK